MKTTIVCGVLGAGKTTFMGNILRHTPEKSVVLVNDLAVPESMGKYSHQGGLIQLNYRADVYAVHCVLTSLQQL